PVSRAFSAYWHLVNDGRETMSFEEGLKQESQRMANNFEFIWYYKSSGLYHDQVKYYIDVFGAENVYILIYEEFINNPFNSINDLLNFLHLEPFENEFILQKNNPSGIPRSKMLNNFVRNKSIVKTTLKKILPSRFRQSIKTELLNKNL